MPLLVFLTFPWNRGQRGHLAFCNLPSKQKLQLVLAPLHSLASWSTEHGLQDPGSLLAHSFQQLDRIDSLSEQVSFLEEQLGSCEFHKTPPHPHRSCWVDSRPGWMELPQMGRCASLRPLSSSALGSCKKDL